MKVYYIMNKKINFALFSLGITISACAKDTPSLPKQPPVLCDLSSSEDVSGFMPEHVLLRTMTQSYCKYYEFVLVDGRIYSKKTGEDKWELFLKTGLPFQSSHRDRFETPYAVRELCCDADSLYVFDDQGIMYSMFIAKGAPEKPFHWRRLSGFPKRNYVTQDSLVIGKRGWSMGARRGDILWYEDRYGNQHHYGTMGLETIYFLTKDGQHIRFTDSGVPADFSHSIECPAKGTFIAQNISVSGDTIFLIGNKGTMYTRLIDFDTMGCDPMFFQYTYDKVEQKSRGTEYISNYSPWALPSEDWAQQARIPLEGSARLSKMISIAQTGQGNYARELRVAGTDKDGIVGYYHKMLYESKWAFTKAELVISDDSWLDPAAEEYGEGDSHSYTGFLTKNGVKVDGVQCSIAGAALSSEDRCMLSLSYASETFSCAVYPVEKWTFVKRHAPGFDGTPKYYFITVELRESDLNNYSEPFREILLDLFQGKNHKLFAFGAQASTEYYEIDSEGRDSNIFTDGRIKNSYSFFMTKSGENIHPFVYKGVTSLFATISETENPMDEKLLLEEGRVYSIKERSFIEQKIAANKELKERLVASIRENLASKGTADLSRWGYNLVDLVTRVTFLNRINFPKIKQMTSFGGDLMSSNASLYRDLLSYTEWTYPSMLELVELRIRNYQKLIDDFNNNAIETSLEPGFHNSFSGYFRDAGIPVHLTGGSSRNVSETGDLLDEFSLDGLFPWFLLQRKDGTVILIRLKNAARTIYDKSESLKIPATFTVVSVPSNERHTVPDNENTISDIDSYEGVFDWNGDTARIYVKNAVFSKKLIFCGK